MSSFSVISETTIELRRQIFEAFESTADADFDILRDYIHRFQQGTWPDPDLVIKNTPSPAETDLEFSCED